MDKRAELSAITVIFIAIVILGVAVFIGFRYSGDGAQEEPEAQPELPPELPVEPQQDITPPPGPPTEPQQPTTKEFTIEADDKSFSIDGQDVSSITVNSGSMVRIDFLVSATQVYFGGLEFRGCGTDTGKVNPGESTTVMFLATESCTISSYWPASNRLKDRLQVVVE